MKYEYNPKEAARKFADNAREINRVQEALWLAGVRGYPAKVTLYKPGKATH